MPRTHHNLARPLCLALLAAAAVSCVEADVDLHEEDPGLRDGPLIDHGDGTYHYALPPNAELHDKWVGPFSMVYAGQANYAWQPELFDHDTINLEGDAPYDPDADAGELVLIDDLHRRWFVSAIDHGQWSDAVTGYDAMVEQLFGLEPVGEPDGPSNEQPGPAPFQPWAWSTADCTGAPFSDDVGIWDGNDMNPFFSPPSTRMKKTVVLLRNNNPNCSGVMIDDNVVLTAAHCVLDDNFDAHDLSTIDVCTQGNIGADAQCSDIDALVHLREIDFGRKDWAVLRTTAPLGAGNFMALSRAGNSTIESHSAFTSGYPGFLDTSCIPNPGTAIGTDGVHLSREGQWTSSPDVWTSTYYIKTHIDSSAGASGAPIYYYPDGCCGRHFVTGILTGFRRDVDDVDDSWVGGPKVPKIRKVILGGVEVLLDA